MNALDHFLLWAIHKLLSFPEMPFLLSMSGRPPPAYVLLPVYLFSWQDHSLPHSGHTGPLLRKAEFLASSVSSGSDDKEPACQCRRCKRRRVDPWVRKILGNRKWQPTPVFLPRKSHWQRILAGYSPWGHKELDTTEWLTLHTWVKWKASGKVLYSTGSSARGLWWPRGARGGPGGRGTCVYVADSLSVQQKLMQHCKAIILQ